MRALAILCLTVIASTLAAGEPKTVTFIACPIYRDTDSGRKSGCWLADHHAAGIRYDVSAAPMKPQLGHQVLVEGVESGDVNACGGVSLRPVRTSQLSAACPATLIPAETYPGRRFDLPPDVLQPMWVPRELPPPPYSVSDFNIFFDFDNSFLVYQHSEIVLEKAVLYIKASKARQVQVLGYSVTKPLHVDGLVLKETQALAQSRAQAVAVSLERLGVDPAIIKTSWRSGASPMQGDFAPTLESGKRRATIRVIPAE